MRALPSSDNVGRDTLTVMCRAADIQPIQPESSVAIPAAPSHTVAPPRRRRRRLSKNARVLLLAGILFSFITVTQYVAALAAHSLALAVDCASMLADTISYSGNLLAECAPARLKQRLELVMSAISLLLHSLLLEMEAGIGGADDISLQHMSATFVKSRAARRLMTTMIMSCVARKRKAPSSHLKRKESASNSHLPAMLNAGIVHSISV